MTFRRSHAALVISCVLLLVIAGLPSCKSTTEKDASEVHGRAETNVLHVDLQDPLYRLQLKNAKDSLPFFTELLKTRSHNHFDFFAKAEFTEEDRAEHLWFAADSLVGNKIVGILDNEPRQLKNISYKEGVAVGLKDIEDWAIYDKDSLIAGNFITYE